MWIFLTPLVKSEINWFYSCKARQRCISFFDSGWQPVKVLWIFHCLKNEAPPPYTVWSPVCFLSVSFFFFISSQILCVCCLTSRAHLVRLMSLFPPTCFSHVSWYHCFFTPWHNGFTSTLTSPSSSMSPLTCLNASRVPVSRTFQTHCRRGYLIELSQHDRQFQGEEEISHCDKTQINDYW